MQPGFSWESEKLHVADRVGTGLCPRGGAGGGACLKRERTALGGAEPGGMGRALALELVVGKAS